MQSYQTWLFSYKAQLYDGREPNNYITVEGVGYVLHFSHGDTAIVLDEKSGRVYPVLLENLQKT